MLSGERKPLNIATPDYLSKLENTRKTLQGYVDALSDERWFFYRHPILFTTGLLLSGIVTVTGIALVIENLPAWVEANDEAENAYDHVILANQTLPCDQVFPISDVCSAEKYNADSEEEQACQTFADRLCQQLPWMKQTVATLGATLGASSLVIGGIFILSDKRLVSNPTHIPSSVKKSFEEIGKPLEKDITKKDVIELLNSRINTLDKEIAAIKDAGVSLSSSRLNMGFFGRLGHAVSYCLGCGPKTQSEEYPAPRYGSMGSSSV